ncbi:hypothetical protein JAAARDRAFT_64002 [Jaapia argillacea MUCL 33604]|uniref:NAD(P)-binding protein n=1 Tax=Jaapia argillacea MUCL 33604 TaxID=933084 RepID=A0A067QAK0_9AGAM|nr:hypothetical protein JAAARDRAFT_64002 [Jaapia argillacea MUCL 33604]
MSKQLVWLITGTSSGIGDKVIATARSRSLSKLEDLRAQGADTLELDVTSGLDSLKEVAKKAVAIYGRVDVLVNNAGYLLFGAIEENTPEETFDQFNTNVFGALNVARAFLPHMRERKTGTIIWLGSVAGWWTGPSFGVYCGTKHAIRAISQSLHDEVAPLGLRSICVELGYFRTDLLSGDNRSPYISRIGDYKEITAEADAHLEASNQHQPGDPKKGVEVIVDLVKGEGAATGREVPAVIDLGTDCYQGVRGVCESTLKRLEEWESVSRSTDF